MSEWSNVHAWKACVRKYRGFESRLFRQVSPIRTLLSALFNLGVYVLVYRQLKKNDETKLYDLISQIETNLQEPKFWLPINSVSKNHFFDNDWTYFLGLFDNDELIGASALFFNEHEFGESLSHCKNVKIPIAEIGRCMILPSYRGNNLIYKLNTELIKIAKEKGIKTVLATIHPENIPSQTSFKKLGFNIETTIVKNNDYIRNVLLLEL